MPEPVAREIERHGPEDVTARAIRTTPWLERVEAPKTPSVVEAWDLGEGESSVLAWAHALSYAFVDTIPFVLRRSGRKSEEGS